MNMAFDGLLSRDEVIRVVAAQIAAEVTGDGHVVASMLSKAKQIENYIKTGDTRGR